MSLCKELVFLILQFFHEEGFERTAHVLEHEMGIFFDMEYFENLVLSGNWDEVEKYLSGFTRLEDDEYSIKIYFEIRKQKFLEALDGHDRVKALDILVKDLKPFAKTNEELYKEMTQLLTLDNFRNYGPLSLYGDSFSARKHMIAELKNIIKSDPLFQDKLNFPHMDKSRLRRLINQSLNWQHIRCAYPQPDPEISTLFMDHQCQRSHHSHSVSVENEPLNVFSLFKPFQATAPSFSCQETSTVTQSLVSDGSANINASSSLEIGFNSVAKVADDQNSDCESETRFSGPLNEVASAATFTSQTNSQVFNNHDSVPNVVHQVLTEGSPPTSMDFHPIQQNLLLVGTDTGEIGLWEVSSGKKLFSRKFRIWKIKNISKTFLVALVRESHISVNRLSWSPDGSLFGVAHSKHIVQLYSYHGVSNIQKHLEIDAHVGAVNDLAFSKPDKLLYLITCGNDKFIQVWDVNTGARHYTFEGHGAPVYSVRPHVKEGIHFIFSTSTNGEIKAWLYDNMGPRVNYDAPGQCCTRMAYTADGKRLFSCGTTKDGESFIVEWDESEGYLKRNYQELSKCSSNVVQFDTSNNQFLIAGDDHLIKVWDIDHAELLTVIDADGDLPASPHVRFNKGGTIMAVTANHNGIKILANHFGYELMQTSENVSANAYTVLSGTLKKLAVNPILTAVSTGATKGVSGEASPVKLCNVYAGEGVKPKLAAESIEILEVWKSKFNQPSQSQSLKLPSQVKTDKISGLIYTHVGNAILALASNGIHLLWKWSRNETNLSGRATTKVFPQLWQPRSGLLMTNDLTDATTEECLPCFALSKNDSYLVSASKGMVSLFNMMTFKKMRAFMAPSAGATCIAFDSRDSNVIAIGTDDFTVLIYHARYDWVISKLNGHSKRITGLAFSNTLNVLVSSGADAQIIVWDTIGWGKKKSCTLQIPVMKLPSDTYVQFHQDQRHFLAVHETQLAIFEATELGCMKQWDTGDNYPRISCATFSCDSQLVYACFVDGTVLIFDALDFHQQCKLGPSAYLPPDISSNACPLTIAAHPQEPNQFALGLTDGGVVVVEPPESSGKWDVTRSFTSVSSPA
ncbi:protein TOPLESS-like [Diospyros lotus]|uniref:protein TOPLESS-like n=1 Tax=Diospyros lotus TaxID=55363 RepID=UPI00224CB13C|nr:protein TOPLESS-like [Diospyros lotus]